MSNPCLKESAKFSATCCLNHVLKVSKFSEKNTKLMGNIFQTPCRLILDIYSYHRPYPRGVCDHRGIVINPHLVHKLFKDLESKQKLKKLSQIEIEK